MDLNDLAEQIHAWNCHIGWWDDPDQCLLTKIQLISTEISEATEGERKNLMDDKIPTRKMGEVELADALIRTLDLGARLDMLLPERDDDIGGFCSPENNIYVQHFGIGVHITRFGIDYYDDDPFLPETYSDLVQSIICVAKNQGYDIIGAALEKMEYNKIRSDHKRENREKENGKKV